MNTATKRRIEALEVRQKPKEVYHGLQHFYETMTQEERERSLAPFYGEASTNAKP